MKTYLLSALAGFLGGLVSLMCYGLLAATPAHFATVNINAVIDSEVKAVAKDGALSVAARKKRVAAFGQRLERVLYQLGRGSSRVLLVKEAVVSGAPDMTDEVRAALDS